MAEYRYGERDRQRQLRQLAEALPPLIELLRTLPQYAGDMAIYQDALAQAERLLKEGFTAEDVKALGRAVPDLFYRHKDWLPPGEADADGTWREAPWFAELERRLTPVRVAASQLESLGYY